MARSSTAWQSVTPVGPSIPVSSFATQDTSPERRRRRLLQLPRLASWRDHRLLSSLRWRILGTHADKVEIMGGGTGASDTDREATVSGEDVQQVEETHEEGDIVAQLRGQSFDWGKFDDELQAFARRRQRRRNLQTQRRASASCSGFLAELRTIGHTSSTFGEASTTPPQPSDSSGTTVDPQRDGRQSASFLLKIFEDIDELVERSLAKEESPTSGTSRHQGFVRGSSTSGFDGIWKVEQVPINHVDDRHSILFIRKGFLFDWYAKEFRLETVRGHTAWDGKPICLSPCDERLIVIKTSTGLATRYARVPAPQ